MTDETKIQGGIDNSGCDRRAVLRMHDRGDIQGSKNLSPSDLPSRAPSGEPIKGD
jgi:hypothetical protein